MRTFANTNKESLTDVTSRISLWNEQSVLRFRIGIGTMKGTAKGAPMNSEKARTLGAYIRQQREAADLSTRALAAEVGLDMSQIVRLEQGSVASPKAEVLSRIADTLDLPVTDLLTLAGYPTTHELPSFTPYLRAKYKDMPTEAVEELEHFFTRLARKHGVHGPIDREDER
jgi:transcriptional regulator with XRE-family HTH domain